MSANIPLHAIYSRNSNIYIHYFAGMGLVTSKIEFTSKSRFSNFSKIKSHRSWYLTLQIAFSTALQTTSLHSLNFRYAPPPHSHPSLILCPHLSSLLSQPVTPCHSHYPLSTSVSPCHPGHPLSPPAPPCLHLPSLVSLCRQISQREDDHGIMGSSSIRTAACSAVAPTLLHAEGSPFLHAEYAAAARWASVQRAAARRACRCCTLGMLVLHDFILSITTHICSAFCFCLPHMWKADMWSCQDDAV